MERDTTSSDKYKNRADYLMMLAKLSALKNLNAFSISVEGHGTIDISSEAKESVLDAIITSTEKELQNLIEVKKF